MKERYKVNIEAIDIRSNDTAVVRQYEIDKEELEALVANKFVHEHKLQVRDNVAFRAKITEV